VDFPAAAAEAAEAAVGSFGFVNELFFGTKIYKQAVDEKLRGIEDVS
jgi:hypothetical protein